MHAQLTLKMYYFTFPDFSLIQTENKLKSFGQRGPDNGESTVVKMKLSWKHSYIVCETMNVYVA